ncbi:MAG: hypothetical protein AB8B62_04325 [Roseobacter sp.]
MTERALSETAMLASLRDIKLPVDAAGGVIAELAATVGISGLVALGVAGVLRVISLKRAEKNGKPLQNHRDALVDLPDADRRLALLHLLRAHAPERYAQVRASLYRPSGGVETAELEAEVNRLV